MPVLAPLAAERLGDAVDRRLRRAVGGVAGRMAEQAARRRHQDDLAALALLEHLLAGGARHQPGLRDVGVHHVEEIAPASGRRSSTPCSGRRRPPGCRRGRSARPPPRRSRRSWLPSSAAWRRPRPCRRAARTRRRPSSARRHCRPHSTTLAPAPASTFAASAPNAPDAPVTIAVLPWTSNSESGFFEEVFGHGRVPTKPCRCRHGRACPGHPRLACFIAAKTWMRGSSPRMTECVAPPRRHFTGATATAIVQTSLPRLMISRLSFGPM